MYKNIFNIEGLYFNIDDILKIAFEAGKEIMSIYNKDFNVEFKDDNSPLTIADKNAHKIIEEGLREYNLPILSEEGRDIPYEERKNWEFFWMIDPLDGTKEFIKKNGEFTINIALIHKNNPVFGVVYAPAVEVIYFTDSENSYKATLSVKEFSLKNIEKLPKRRNDNKFIIVASKSHLNEDTKNFIENIKTDKEKEFISKGSSLKLCMVAEGSADIYPRLAPTMEWDTAAADAIVRKAGKMIYNFKSMKSFKYNKKYIVNPWFIICTKKKENDY